MTTRHRGVVPADTSDTTRPIVPRHDHGHFSIRHYRGRGGDQSRTGPATPWLTEAISGFEHWPTSPPPSRRRDVSPDKRLLDTVRRYLHAQSELRDCPIDILVRQGSVTLQGEVFSRHAKYLAEDLAASVDGVIEVYSTLGVRPGIAHGATELTATMRPQDWTYGPPKPLPRR